MGTDGEGASAAVRLATADGPDLTSLDRAGGLFVRLGARAAPDEGAGSPANASIPSSNFTLAMIFRNWFCRSRRRQAFSAPSTSLNTMASAVLSDRHPFERMVR
jgi:hypothetical protein